MGLSAWGVASEITLKEMESRINQFKRIKERLKNGLKKNIDDIIFNGHPEYSLPNLISLSIKYIEGESIVLMLDQENIAVATKSACASGSLRASHSVLSAIGRDYADAQGTLVITYGRDTTENDIDRFLEVLKKAVDRLREMFPPLSKKMILAPKGRHYHVPSWHPGQPLKTRKLQYVAFCLFRGSATARFGNLYP